MGNIKSAGNVQVKKWSFLDKYEMILIAIILGVLFFMGGCSKLESPTIVKIPISQCPVPEIPAKPDLPIKRLVSSGKPPEVMKAYVESVYILNDHSDRLTNILLGYSKT